MIKSVFFCVLLVMGWGLEAAASARSVRIGFETALAARSDRSFANRSDRFSSKAQSDRSSATQSNPFPKLAREVKVALIGDTDVKSSFVEVLKLVESENADVLMVNGDLGYSSSARTWQDRVISNLDIDNVAVIGSLGNHDVEDGQAESYVAVFNAFRNGKNKLIKNCTGQPEIETGRDVIAVDEVCTFANVSIIASGIGQVLSRSYLEDRLESKLNSAPTENWKLVGYHFTLASMNPGIKSDENTHRFFEMIRRHGAIGAQAHTHSVMASCPIVSPFAPGAPVMCHPSFGQDLENRFIAPGVGIYVDSSLGGKKARERDRCGDPNESGCRHMIDLITREGYTRTDGSYRQDFDPMGALFITFNYGGDPNKAFVYYKSNDGQVIFKFDITR